MNTSLTAFGNEAFEIVNESSKLPSAAGIIMLAESKGTQIRGERAISSNNLAEDIKKLDQRFPSEDGWNPAVCFCEKNDPNQREALQVKLNEIMNSTSGEEQLFATT